MLGALMTRDEPLVKQIPPAPGSRAERYVQLLCPDLHPIDVPFSGAPSSTAAPPAPALAARVESLEAELATVKAALRRLATALGEGDPPA